MPADPKLDSPGKVAYRVSMTTMTTTTSMMDHVEAMINAEVERRVASQLSAKRAELDERLLILGARHQELDRLIEKLTGAVSSSDTESVSSVPTPPPTPVYTKLPGTPDFQLHFIFNTLRPRASSVAWAMLRAAYNTEPSRFTLGEGHVSDGDPTPHQTIFYNCPVHTATTVNKLVIKIHVQYTELAGGKRQFNRVLAHTLAGSLVPQEIANFV